MSKYRLHSFERNRYFPGKTLTTRDFKAEQDYFNEKRYLLSHYIHGSGIADGLQIDMVDGETITVNPGVAIDPYGREIIVDSSVTVNISQIEGAPIGSVIDDRNVILCIKYYDTEKEPVTSVLGSVSNCDETYEYNRIKEKYKLVIKELDDMPGEYLAHLLSNTTEIYNDGIFSIKRTTPSWVNPNELFYVQLTAERLKPGSAAEITVYEKLDNNLYLNDDNANPVSFVFKNDSSESVITKDYMVRAVMDPAFSPNGDSIMSSIKLLYGSNTVNSSSKASSIVNIIDTPLSREVITSYFKEKNTSVSDGDGESVFLASLHLRANSRSQLGFKILEVNCSPFNQYVCSNPILYELISDLETRLTTQKYPLEIKKTSAAVERINPGPPPSADVEYTQVEKHLNFDFKFPKEMATGVVYFDIESEILEPGDNGITEIIDPGLGAGPIFINVECEQCRYRESVIPSDSILFGAYPNHNTGKFKIWYKVVNTIERVEGGKRKTIHALHFRWWAFTNVFDKGETRARRFSITPKRQVVYVGGSKDETCSLTAMLNGKKVEGVTWEIMPDKTTGVRPSFSIKNGVITIPKGSNSGKFTVKGTYKNMYDKVVISIQTV